MTLFASLSLGCALPVLAALAALCDLDDAASALHLPHALVAVIAIAVLSLAVGLVAFLARHRLPGERPSPTACWSASAAAACACQACAYRCCNC